MHRVGSTRKLRYNLVPQEYGGVLGVSLPAFSIHFHLDATTFGDLIHCQIVIICPVLNPALEIVSLLMRHFEAP